MQTEVLIEEEQKLQSQLTEVISREIFKKYVDLSSIDMDSLRCVRHIKLKDIQWQTSCRRPE